MTTPNKTQPAAQHPMRTQRWMQIFGLLCLLALAACVAPAAPTAQPPISKMSPPLIAQLSGEQVGPDEVLLTISVWSWAGEATPAFVKLTLPTEATPLDNNPLFWQVNLAKDQYFTEPVRARLGAFDDVLTFKVETTTELASLDPNPPACCYQNDIDTLYLRQTPEAHLAFSRDMYFGAMPTADPAEGVSNEVIAPALP